MKTKLASCSFTIFAAVVTSASFLLGVGAFFGRPVSATPDWNGYMKSYKGGDSHIDLFCHEGTLIVVAPPFGTESGVGGASIALSPDNKACK